MNITPKSEHIPRATIRRLAMYVQVLETMQKKGIEVTSSDSLAKACGINASQVRRDLAYFGEFGVRGVGYNIVELIDAIRLSLGLDRQWQVALVGVGNLGRALLHYSEFKAHGFNIVRAFDCDPNKVGETVYGLEVLSTDKLQEEIDLVKIEMGILTTSSEHAQEAADILIDAGITSILNFAPIRISAPSHVSIEYVDFFHYLYNLAFDAQIRS